MLYFFAGVMLFIGTDFLTPFKLLNIRQSFIFNDAFNSIFGLIEFTAFYYFFKECLQAKILVNILLIYFTSLTIVITLFFLELAFSHYSGAIIDRHSLFINVFEFFLIFLMCLAYFYDLFTNSTRINLTERPSFFIVTSAFFFIVIPMPFFMVAGDVFKNGAPSCYIAFDCHFLLLITLLLSLSKTFLSKTPNTT